jgi:hypothetical protein
MSKDLNSIRFLSALSVKRMKLYRKNTDNFVELKRMN